MRRAITAFPLLALSACSRVSPPVSSPLDTPAAPQASSATAVAEELGIRDRLDQARYHVLQQFPVLADPGRVWSLDSGLNLDRAPSWSDLYDTRHLVLWRSGPQPDDPWLCPDYEGRLRPSVADGQGGQWLLRVLQSGLFQVLYLRDERISVHQQAEYTGEACVVSDGRLAQLIGSQTLRLDGVKNPYSLPEPILALRSSGQEILLYASGGSCYHLHPEQGQLQRSEVPSAEPSWILVSNAQDRPVCIAVPETLSLAQGLTLADGAHPQIVRARTVLAGAVLAAGLARLDIPSREPEHLAQQLRQRGGRALRWQSGIAYQASDQLRLRLAEDRLSEVSGEALSAVVEAWLGLHQAEQYLAVEEARQELSRAHVHTVQLRLEQGLVLEADLLAAQRDLGQSQAARDQAQARVAQWQATLRTYLGLAPQARLGRQAESWRWEQRSLLSQQASSANTGPFNSRVFAGDPWWWTAQVLLGSVPPLPEDPERLQQALHLAQNQAPEADVLRLQHAQQAVQALHLARQHVAWAQEQARLRRLREAFPLAYGGNTLADLDSIQAAFVDEALAQQQAGRAVARLWRGEAQALAQALSEVEDAQVRRRLPALILPRGANLLADGKALRAALMEAKAQEAQAIALALDLDPRPLGEPLGGERLLLAASRSAVDDRQVWVALVDPSWSAHNQRSSLASWARRMAELQARPGTYEPRPAGLLVLSQLGTPATDWNSVQQAVQVLRAEAPALGLWLGVAAEALDNPEQREHIAQLLPRCAGLVIHLPHDPHDALLQAKRALEQWPARQAAWCDDPAAAACLRQNLAQHPRWAGCWSTYGAVP